MSSVEHFKALMWEMLRRPVHDDPMEAFLHLGDDTERRAYIAREILSKSVDMTKLVRVQRTVSRGGKSYMTHVWVLPAQVKKGDIVVQNKAAYDKWAKENGGGTGLGSTKGRVNPMAKLKGKQQANGGKPKPATKPKPEAKPEPSEKPKPKTTPPGKTAIKAKPEVKPKPKTKPKPKSAPAPKKKKTDVTDAALETMMRTMTVDEVQNLIASGKLTLTKQQMNTIDAWAAEVQRKKERFAGAGLHPDYQRVLEDRFEKATPDAQKAFDKYAGKIAKCIGDSHYHGNAKYVAYQDAIFFDQSSDRFGHGGDRRTAGSTLNHEIGHLIDFRAVGFTGMFDGKITVSYDAEFLAAIRSDVKAAEKAMQDQMGGARIYEVRQRISSQMAIEGGYTAAGVQDIFGGAIKGKYPGSFSYHPANYWKCNTKWHTGTQKERDKILGTEAFAQMYEACSSQTAAAAMEKWLPNAFKRFKELLADIAKD